MNLNLAFRIQKNALFIPPDQNIYSTHKSSVKNITLSNLIKMLSRYKLCIDIKYKIAKK